ncbi:MAG: hypothetical protein COW12_05570 [Candidatus Omnitrophica bacterium CG12_big_fil_rev_8_21_14_0_65_45_16]|nr:MAG: hypothetical protein COW12_05570 [Candidatus Omnitrophica bacterium CG12_big_fil_rev_8_21_14_0_65_45_16]
MSNSEEDNQNIKVVDRRRFSESGDSIENDTDSNEKRESVAAPNKPAEPTVAENLNSDKQASRPTGESSGKIDLPSFLVGIYSQTLIFLGEIPNPETNVVTKNIEAARQNIDILSLLEDKTKGNLSEEEEKLFTEILNNLRLLFVNRSKGN